MTAALRVGQRGILGTGVPFLVRERPGADVTTVSVWILVGSRDEARSGVAHLFEHVVMQAVPAGRALRVVDEIEAFGGEANAMTTRDHVVLYARVPTADAPAALAVLVDAATSTAFTEEVIDSERRVVLEELRLAAADPTDIVHDAFFAAAYGAHPLGRPVGGLPSSVAELNLGDLTAWARESVCPQRLGVVVSGGIGADEVHELLRATALDQLPATGAATTGALNLDAVGPPPPLVARRNDVSLSSDTAAVVLGGPAFALTDPALPAAEVVLELLAGGNASVLVEEIRSRLGLSYDISGGVSPYRDTGIWRVAIATAPEQREHVLELATNLVTGAVARGFAEAEVALARRRVAGLLRLEAESSLEDAMLAGRYALVGGWAEWSLTAHLDKLATVDAAEVGRCARLMLMPMCLATAGGTGD
jgi:predicted Zn-dependent peptidase